MPRKRSTPEATSIQSVERALKILFLLADAETPLTVGQIAEQLDVHSSTASRLLGTLAQQHVVAHNGSSYRLGLGLLHLAHVVLSELDIRTVAHPHLQRLAQDTGFTVYLATMFDEVEIYLDQVNADQTVSRSSWIGYTIPLHTASSGKVLLAHLPADRLKAILERGLAACTRHTITNANTLLEQLQIVRERGYATSCDEYVMGFSSVAAPVFDRSGENVAAVSLSGASSVLPPERLDELAPRVVATSSVISLELGYKGSSDLNGHP